MNIQTKPKQRMLGRVRVTQQEIVFAVFAVLFVAFSALPPGVPQSTDNMLTLLQNVAVLGILGLAMAIVVLGRGIDISLIAALAVPPGLVLQMVQDGHALTGLDRRCACVVGRLWARQWLAYRLCRRAVTVRDAGDRPFPRRFRTSGSVLGRRRAVEPRNGRLPEAGARFDSRRADTDRDVCDRLHRGGAVPAPDALGRLHLCDRRQPECGAGQRDSDAADYRSAICARCADRLLRRPRPGSVGQFDADPHLQFDPYIRRDPRRGSGRHRALWGSRRRPQRHYRNAV